MSAHRHPCVGDLTYGADPTLAKRLGLTRQWLHAVRLGFEHPGGRAVGGVRERLPRRTCSRRWTACGRRATRELVPGPTWCGSPRIPPTARPASRCARRSSSSSRGCRRTSSTTRTTPGPCTCSPCGTDGVPLGAGRLLYGEAAAGKTGGEPGVGSLGRLAVVEEARGLGVGVALVRAIEEAARERGLTAVDLRAQTHALRVLRAARVCGVRGGVPGRGDAAPGDAADRLLSVRARCRWGRTPWRRSWPVLIV